MKLFLHWLRWDLRRFRLLLLVWMLLVLGYAAFLGWLHLDILTIDPEWLEWSKPIAVVLSVGYGAAHLANSAGGGGWIRVEPDADAADIYSEAGDVGSDSKGV